MINKNYNSMLNKLHIKNFQSHKDSLLEFDKGVNVIVGLSDAGKSAIVRAIRWKLRNRPSGNAFQSYWGGKTSVEITTGNNTIIRAKDKQEEYIINDKVLTAFGRNVPEEVSQILNIDEINFEHQKDSFYLLNQSPGEVATHFNKVSNLYKIDTSIKNIKKWKKQSNQSIENYNNLIKENEEKLNSDFNYLKDFENTVIEFEQTQEKINDNENKKQKIQDTIDNIISINKKIETNKAYIKNEKLVTDALDYYATIKQNKEKINNLKEVINNITKIQEEIKDIKYFIEGEKLINQAITIQDKLTETKNKIGRINELTSQVVDTNKEIKSVRERLLQREEQFKKEFPDTCPLCGTKINK